MNRITKIVESFKRKRYTGGITVEQIKKAEETLNVKFSSDYIELLVAYGSLCAKGEEILGVDENNYDVVKATIEARSENSDFPIGMYVVENMVIDGILLIQNTEGAIFTYQPATPIKKVNDSLCDYLENL